MARPATPPRRRALVIVTQVYLDGGIQRFNRTFLCACDRLGVDCHVLSLGDPEQANTRWLAPPSARLETFGGNKLRFALRVGQLVLRREWQFIVVGHINLLELVSAAARLRRGARTFLIAHGIDVWTGIGARRRNALGCIDTILCVSAYTRDRMRQQAPEIPIERFRVFPNALSESWNTRSAQEGHEQPAWLPERYLLSVTRVDRGDRYKGIITVLEALSMLEDQSIHYVMTGRGDDLEFLKRAAQHFGVSARVHFTGAVSDEELPALYRHCVAFVLPSGKEGFGIVYLEAMRFGACVVAAREKGVLEVIRDEQTGLFVNFADVVDLKRALDRVIGDAPLRSRLSEAGRASVMGDGPFTFSAYTARLGDVWGLSEPVAPHRGVGPGSACSPVVAVRAGTGESCA